MTTVTHAYSHVGQVAAFHISNGARVGKQLPARLKLLDWGENRVVKKDPKHPDAIPTKDVVRVGDKTVEALSVNQVKFGFDRVALDFEHNSLPGHPNFEKSPCKVAAFGVPEILHGDGLYLRNIEYTAAGTEFAGEYYDLTPAPLLDENREVTFLHSVALCAHGAVEGLHFYSADFLPVGSIARTNQPNAATNDGMSPQLVALLSALFGVPPYATDAELLNAARKYVASLGDDSVNDDLALNALSVNLPSPGEDDVRRKLGLTVAQWEKSKRLGI